MRLRAKEDDENEAQGLLGIKNGFLECTKSLNVDEDEPLQAIAGQCY